MVIAKGIARISIFRKHLSPFLALLGVAGLRLQASAGGLRGGEKSCVARLAAEGSAVSMSRAA